VPETQEDRELSSPGVPPTPSEASPSSEVTPPRSLAELSTDEIIERYATEEPPSGEEPEESQPDLASIGNPEREDLYLDTPDPLFQTYFAKIRLKIQRELRYPSEAERQQIQGQSLVRFVLTARGEVAELKVLNRSGHPILDEASISAIRNASPFGPFPDEIRAKWRQLPIRAKFRFGQ
jgi:protein TonB